MLVVKLSICLAIIGICILLGIRKSKKYETRERMIQEMKTLLNGMNSEIQYMLTCIPDAIEKLRQSMTTNLKYVLGAISVDMLSNNYDNEDKINKSIYENIYTIEELSNYDKEVICKAISTLGKGDIDSQLGIINGTIALLDNQLLEAIEEKNKNLKMYRSLGAAVGLMIVIVFI